jgi:hypothetical protein
MKQKILSIVLLALSITPLFAQKANVGIGTTNPDNSAILDIQSTEKGFLTPRMSFENRNSILSPATGLMIYQTDMESGFYFFNGDKWAPLSDSEAKAVSGVDGDWTIIGNAGTDPSLNFIGTTDNQSLAFRVNNTAAGLIGNDGRTFLGASAGLTNTGAYNVAIGFQALRDATGSQNVGVGLNALVFTTTGSGNTGIGANSLILNTTGSNNMGLGNNSLYSNVSGGFNIGVGDGALYNSTGSNNVAVGQLAGSATTGSNSVFIGHNAGSNEAGGDKLYISNSGSVTPLVYGDFSSKFLAIGEVSVADRAAAASGGYRLLVKGGMMTEKIKVAIAGSGDWADYVFEEGYKMLSLNEVEEYIKVNKHLPNVPSTAEILENGIDVAKTDAKLLEKIEELTLYLIDLSKEVEQLKKENLSLKVTPIK